MKIKMTKRKIINTSIITLFIAIEAMVVKYITNINVEEFTKLVGPTSGVSIFLEMILFITIANIIGYFGFRKKYTNEVAGIVSLIAFVIPLVPAISFGHLIINMIQATFIYAGIYLPWMLVALTVIATFIVIMFLYNGDIWKKIIEEKTEIEDELIKNTFDEEMAIYNAE